MSMNILKISGLFAIGFPQEKVSIGLILCLQTSLFIYPKSNPGYQQDIKAKSITDLGSDHHLAMV